MGTGSSDSDLGIVLSTVLEADVDNSVSRITAQLPDIADKINASSKIKVGIEINTDNMSQQAKKVAQAISSATKNNGYDIQVKLDESSVNKVKSALSGLGLDSSLAKKFTSELNNMGITIDKISGKWSEVEGEQNRLLSLTVQGTDALQRTVSVLQTYDSETQELNTTVTNVTTNLSAQRKEQEKLAEQARKDNESRVTYLSKIQEAVDKIKASYSGDTSATEVTDTTKLNELESAYQDIINKVSEYGAVSGNLTSQQKLEIEQMVSSLKALTTEYQTQTKNEQTRIASISKMQTALEKLQSIYTGDSSTKPIVNTEHLAAVNAKYQEIANTITQLSSASGKLTQDQIANINKEISSLDLMIKEYQNLEYVATRLRAKDVNAVNADQLAALDQLEEDLSSAGILTDEFKSKIGTLRTELSTAFDGASLVAFMNNFDSLNNDVKTFQNRLSSVDTIYKNLSQVESAIAKIQEAMLKVDSSSMEYDGLQAQLAVQENIRQSLLNQLAPYQDIIQYSSQAAKTEQQRLAIEAELLTMEGRLADEAANITTKMETMPTVITSIEAKFSALSNPTQTVSDHVSKLRTLMEAVNNASSDKDKIIAFNDLQTAINACNKEISSLNSQSRVDIIDSKFTANLEKAKADLQTVARQWSALKSDPGLNAQLQTLESTLARVQTSADLTKWNAQFSTFKSEVKAAGLNTQSLFDTIKNNLAKVTSWASATSLLYKSFTYLENAIDTVIALDTAMIDLRKTTDETEETYAEFYNTANSTAKALGATTEEIISQTAEWSRLGYSLEEAAELAENSAIFAAVSPEMDSDVATEGLVSIIKAFDIEVEDTLDGIVSKINSVGNAFAVSNEDLVEALTRGSSSMSAANNTFDETVALATAAIEITQDAAKVGNGLKTVSMRIRGYDEETEEYSEDIAVLTGNIADLTKVASNNFTGVSLFEEGDPDTYRSTYDILSDISEIWDELTDKNQAELLDTLFGTYQAQLGAAILSNFDQAEAALETMEGSAGSAEAEMEAIYDSLEYKLNALGQTWVSVATNLFQTDDVGMVVEGLTALSNVVDVITDKLGLFGTALVIEGVAGIVRFKKELTAIKPAMESAFSVVGDTVFDENNTQSVIKYAAAISDLDYKQREAVLSSLDLNKSQRDTVYSFISLADSADTVSISMAEQVAGLTEGTLATEFNATGTNKMTSSMVLAAVASGKLTTDQAEQILSTMGVVSANEAATTSYNSLAASARVAGETIKSAFIATISNPMTWVSAAITLLPIVIDLVSDLIVTQEEAYEAAENYRQAYDDQISSMEDAEESIATNKERISELQALSNSGTITLIEQEELETLKETNAELELTIANYKELAAQEAANTNESLIESFSKESYDSNTRDVLTEQLVALQNDNADLLAHFNDPYYEWSDEELAQALDVQDRIADLTDVLASGYDSATGTFIDSSVGIEEYARQLLAVYDELNSKKEQGIALTESEESTYAATEDNLAQLLTTVRDEYLDLYVLTDDIPDETYTAWQGIVDAINQVLYPAEYLETKLASLPEDVYDSMSSMGESASLTAEDVMALASGSDELTAFMEENGVSAEELATHFNALSVAEETAEASGESLADEFSDMVEVLSSVQDSYAALQTAKEEMENGGGLSLDTISSLAEVDENYMDYLYTENGIIKLNTEAWEENARAKAEAEMVNIQSSIDELEAENEALRENIAYYEEQRALGNDGGLWSGLISDATSELDENTATIAEHQSRLEMYDIMLSSIGGTAEEASGEILGCADSIRAVWNSADFEDTRESIEELAEEVTGITPDSIAELAEESEELAEILEIDGMNAEFLAKVLSEEIEGNDGFALITEDALALNKALDGMVSEFERVEEAKAKYDAALSADEKDTDFQSYAEAFAALDEEFVAGTTNSNAFWAAAEYLFGADQLEAWGWSDGVDEIYSALGNVVDIFSDADSAGYGLLERLYELSQAGELVNDEGEQLMEISKDAEGAFSFNIDNDNLGEVAEVVGVTEEALLACIEAIGMFGDVNFYDLTEVLAEIKNSDLSATIGELEVINLNALETQLSNLGKTQKEISDIRDALASTDGVSLFDISSDVNEFAQSLVNLNIAASDGVTVSVDYRSLSDLMVELGYAQDDTGSVVKALSELDNVNLTTASGEVATLQEALDYIGTLEFSDTEGNVTDVTTAVEDLDDETTDHVVDEIDNIGDAANDATKDVKKLHDEIKDMDGETVTVKYNVEAESSGSTPTYTETVTDSGEVIVERVMGGYASGTRHAPDGPALVGEEAPELIQSGGEAYLAGTNGPEIVDLDRGAMVWNAEDTKEILSRKSIRGSIPAFLGGTAWSSSVNKTTRTSYLDTDSTTTTVSVTADTSDLEEELEDTLSELEDALEETLGDYEHTIYMLERNGGTTEAIVAEYLKMQAAVEAQAEQYRHLGLSENSDYIQDLQEQWWEYSDEIQSVIVEAYEAVTNELENSVTLTENWFDNAVSDEDVVAFRYFAGQIEEYYKEMQENLHAEAEYYRSLGYSDTSDEVSELSDLWWDYEQEIENMKQSVVDSLMDMATAASDMVDDIQNVYDTLHDAADEYASSQYISVDTLQDILELGAEYMQYLVDENGQLVINEESIQAVIKARTEQMAVENAMAYVERLRLAVNGESTESLETLLYATEAATDGTWGLVYAELALMKQLGELDDSQYAAAMHNVQSLQALANSAIVSISATGEDALSELEEMQDGVGDIIEYVMDMLEDRIDQQIEALEDMKDAYSDIIELKKESLQASKDEADYQDEVADAIEEIADLQAQIDALSLDDSREAQAEKASLLAEMAELQEELADTQADYALDAQTDALDDMEEAYEAEKDAEIAVLEESISSYQKLYDLAIDYISNNWDTLYTELIAWNTEYGTVLNSEISSAWEAALAAAQKYGDYVTALNSLDADIEAVSSSSSGTNYVVADTTSTDTSYTNADTVSRIVNRMRERSLSWFDDDSDKSSLHDDNEADAKSLSQYGVTVTYNSSTGEWIITDDDIIPSNVGKKLYSVYHSGGIVGSDGSIKDNEVLAKLEDGESVLTATMWDNLVEIVDRINSLSESIAGSQTLSGMSVLDNSNLLDRGGSMSSITNNNHPVNITFGDTIVNGNADSSTVSQHTKVTYDMVNQIAKILRI